MPYNETLSPVHTRGNPPIAFLRALVEWGRNESSEVFAPRKDDPGERDIYTQIKPFFSPEKGAWFNMDSRRGALLETLRVLAGFESSWKANTGADTTNPRENSDESYSAGLWQVSYDSRGFGQDLRDMLKIYNIKSGKRFQEVMKENFNFAAGYTARLLRHTCRHHGPVRDHHIDKWLKPASAKEFEELLGL